MPSKKKTEPTRRPVKARGALPAPRVAPRRVRVPVHRRRPVQIVAILLILVIAGVTFQQVSQARDEAAERAAKKSAVRGFVNSFRAKVETPVNKVVGEMSQVPEQFRSGSTDAASFKTKTDEWLKALRDAATSLAEKEVQPSLEETRALFHHGAILFIDAVKVYQSAAVQTDVGQRDALLDEGRNLTDHAGKVFGLGIRALIIEQTRAGLSVPETDKAQFVDRPIPLPQEEVPAQPAPPPGFEGQPPIPPPAP